jgi:tetratricopeptide (TPR) repeat protein
LGFLIRYLKKSEAPSCLVWMLWVLATTASFAQTDSNDSDDRLLQHLADKVTANPEHSDSWRLLGKFYRKQGDREQAQTCLEMALKTGPENAAAHFDMGEFAREQGETEIANEHFAKVFLLAPRSDYARRLTESGFAPLNVSGAEPAELPIVSLADFAELSSTLRESGEIRLVGYEAEPFDSSAEVERRFDQVLQAAGQKNVRATIDIGSLYNSNVTLAPISRYLLNVDAGSAQFFANPDFEWTVVREDWGRLGPVARGLFTVNEDQLSAFNLASFQPGGYFEKDISAGAGQRLARLEYAYNLDFFGGDRLGDRHTLTGSVMNIHPASSIDYFYLLAAYSEFNEDGLTPETDSLDGPTWAAGAARYFLFDNARLPTMTVGIDFESAQTEGSNFSYRSIGGYVDATIVLPYQFSFIPNAAIGYRHFPNVADAENRDVLTGRLGSKLRRQLGPHTTVSAVINYDRFVSDNELFDANRFTSGIVFNYSY